MGRGELNLKGVWTALVTPFRRGKVDMGRLKDLVERAVEAGIAGVVAAGTTGEAPALEEEEWRTVVKTAVEAARGRIAVMAGVGTNNTPHTLHKTRIAGDLGVDALLVVTPYYNKPTPEGLKRHFWAVGEASAVPVVLYHIPGRTGVGIPVSLVKELSLHPRIVGIKEAGGEVQRTAEILAITAPPFSVLSGDDPLTLPMMALGAVGVISVVSNLCPRTVKAMVNAALSGDFPTARAINQRLLPLYRALFIETNPGPIKAAMNLKGITVGEVRPPLAPVRRESLNAIRQALREAGELE